MFGTVTDTFKTKGYVFIRPDGEDNDLFAHVRDFPNRLDFDYLAPGNRVEFEPYNHNNGKRAGKVRVVAQ